MGFFDLRGGGEARAQAVAGEGALAFTLCQLAADSRLHRSLLHKAGDVLVGEALGGDAAVLARDRAKQRTVRDAAQAHPCFEQSDGASFRTGAAADFDLAPTGLAVDRQQGAGS